jgi:hypothetical protein
MQGDEMSDVIGTGDEVAERSRVAMEAWMRGERSLIFRVQCRTVRGLHMRLTVLHGRSVVLYTSEWKPMPRGAEMGWIEFEIPRGIVPKNHDNVRIRTDTDERPPFALYFESSVDVSHVSG